MLTRSSSAEPVPLPVEFPADHRGEDQLQIVDPTSSLGDVLPGWTVVTRPRSSASNSNGSVDTYFIEPGTGREFPSLESVHRHLTGQVNDRRLSRPGAFFKDMTRVYEGSRIKNLRSVEYASKSFRLPKGWAVEEVPRKSSYQIDKYYVERITGRRFRSLVSVERYLAESGDHPDQQQHMLLQYPRRRSKDFSLPDGWIVEEKPRQNSSHIDKSYIEPGTGTKFRSLLSVERYLKGFENGTFDSVSMLQSERLSLVGFQKEVIDPNPPKKVKWVLTGPGGNMFSANMKGSEVSSSVKQSWSEAFVSSIQDRS